MDLIIAVLMILALYVMWLRGRQIAQALKDIDISFACNRFDAHMYSQLNRRVEALEKKAGRNGSKAVTQRRRK